MKDNENKPLYSKKPWWIQILTLGYVFYWLASLMGAGLNSLYIGHIDVDAVTTFAFLSIGIYPLIKILEKM